jgi:integrase
MATLRFFIGGTKREQVPVYVSLSAGRENTQIVNSGLTVDPKTWSNKKQTLSVQDKNEADKKFLKKYAALDKYLNDLIIDFTGEYPGEWLQDAIDKYYGKKAANAKTLNEYITQFIKEAESGDRKNKDDMLLSPGTIRGWKSFQQVLFEYQGIYTEKRLKVRQEQKKPIRKKRVIDFEDITSEFYAAFVRYLNDEGYKKNTKGRFVKTLKIFMKKALIDKLHKNREFEYAFPGFTKKTFAVYLTQTELNKIYNYDLSNDPELDIARDAFMVLAETALRISDYKKVDVNIHTDDDGTQLLYITQQKTRGEIVIPLSTRLQEILKKYDGSLPRIPDQYINRMIKTVAYRCGINEVLRWEDEKAGKTFEKEAPKWKLISCHTGRRSAISNMYLAGIPVISIMSISGHKTESQLLSYIKVTPEENAKKLSLHPYFRNGKLKRV